MNGCAALGVLVDLDAVRKMDEEEARTTESEWQSGRKGEGGGLYVARQSFGR